MSELENKTTPKLTSNTSFVNTKGKYKIGQIFNRPIVAGDLNLVEQDEIYAKMNPDNTVDNLVLQDGSSIISGGGTKPGEIELTLKYYNEDWIGLPIELEGEEGFHYVFDQLIEQVDSFNITDLNTGLSVDYTPKVGGYSDPNGMIEQFTTLHVYEIGTQTEPITITVKGKLRDPETEFTIGRVKGGNPSLTYIPYLIPYDDIVASPDFLNFDVIASVGDLIETRRFSNRHGTEFALKEDTWSGGVSLFVGNGFLYTNEQYTDRNRIFTWQ